ncbi:NF-kappa-B inhibitor-like protein 1 [Daphnia carinata]|uniref:NF-kappa-B inhibitor-like protein 1 n=1 Tax=Daphnia carinata TaxID=120202 RepID=UPI00257FC47B|nr:NF-kappa-B inhibitor-like protein 1 [Daphnia carinata]
MTPKIKKRFDRLVMCVRLNDIQRLEHYIKRKKYAKMHLDETRINKRRETLLHLACRLGKHEIVKFLLNNLIGDPTSMDYKGNTPLHVALKAIMKIDEKNLYIAAYRKMILANLKEMSVSLTQTNLNGQTAKDLLDLADSVYQYHLGGSEKKEEYSQQKNEQEWERKLAAELDYEYENHWGKYEKDFLQEDTDETESYDSWATRMIFEHKQKNSARKFSIPSQAQSNHKSSWTEEDQKKFLKDEETRRQLQKTSRTADRRFLFLSKLSMLIKTENPIEISDLPFQLTDTVESIGQVILLHVKESEDADAKRKALRELQRLWHPDKFSQKFSTRLKEEIRESVLRKVTEISQYLNAFNCGTEANNSR